MSKEDGSFLDLNPQIVTYSSLNLRDFTNFLINKFFRININRVWSNKMSFKKLINFKYIELLEIGAKTSGEFI